jgi:hypothetical protein
MKRSKGMDGKASNGKNRRAKEIMPCQPPNLRWCVAILMERDRQRVVETRFNPSVEQDDIDSERYFFTALRNAHGMETQ